MVIKLSPGLDERSSIFSRCAIRSWQLPWSSDVISTFADSGFLPAEEEI